MNSQRQAQRVLVVANKSWEADPLVSVCLNPKLRPPIQLDLWTPGAAGLFSTPVTGVRPAGVAPAPRCTCTAGNVSIEVWCIQDWMGKANPSSSKIKIQEALPAIFGAGKEPDLVIALGTAAFPDTVTANGCVAIGSSVYLFNPYRDLPRGVAHDSKDDWDDKRKVGHLLTSEKGAALVNQFSLDPDLRFPIDGRLSCTDQSRQSPRDSASREFCRTERS